MKHLLFKASVFASLIFPACDHQSFEEKIKSLYRYNIPVISPEELKKSPGAIILDTRSPEEFRVSHLKGSILIDYRTFKPSDVASIDNHYKVVVYCSIGCRSARIGKKLQKLGFSNVKNLYGGIFHWKNQGNEVISQNGDRTDSVHTYNKVWSKWLKNGIKVYE